MCMCSIRRRWSSGQVQDAVFIRVTAERMSFFGFRLIAANVSKLLRTTNERSLSASLFVRMQGLIAKRFKFARRHP
jgi:hypothetical protein